MKKALLILVLLVLVVSTAWAADTYEATKSLTLEHGENKVTLDEGDPVPAWVPQKLIDLFVKTGGMKKVEKTD